MWYLEKIKSKQGYRRQIDGCQRQGVQGEMRWRGSKSTNLRFGVAIPFSRGSSQTRDWTQVSCTVGRFFTISATIREAHKPLQETNKDLLMNKGNCSQYSVMTCREKNLRQSERGNSLVVQWLGLHAEGPGSTLGQWNTDSANCTARPENKEIKAKRVEIHSLCWIAETSTTL